MVQNGSLIHPLWPICGLRLPNYDHFAVRTLLQLLYHFVDGNTIPTKSMDLYKVTTISCFVLKGFTTSQRRVKSVKEIISYKCTHKLKIFHFDAFFNLKWPWTLKLVLAHFCSIVFEIGSLKIP